METEDKKQLERIGIKVRKLRRKQKLAQEQLAELMGISSMTLYRIEKGMADMNVTTLKKIADSLQVSPSEIVDE